MQVFDYNGEGRWARDEILRRYSDYVAEMGLRWRDLSPRQIEDSKRGWRWIYPVMDRVIEGIKAGDRACVRLGIEFIEEDRGFRFGRILKSNTARALRRVDLAEDEKRRIRRRVLGMLRAGHVPREYTEYAKLLRHIGLGGARLPAVEASARPGDHRVMRFYKYFRDKTGSDDVPA